MAQLPPQTIQRDPQLLCVAPAHCRDSALETNQLQLLDSLPDYSRYDPDGRVATLCDSAYGHRTQEG
jgi:hypothetical protein